MLLLIFPRFSLGGHVCLSAAGDGRARQGPSGVSRPSSGRDGAAARGGNVSRGKSPPPEERAACPSDRKPGGWEGSQPARRSPAAEGLSRSNQPPLLPGPRDRGAESEGENVFSPLCRSHIIQISNENQAANYHKISVGLCADLLKSHIFCRL